MSADAKANILLVDDQPRNLQVLEAILADLGQNLVRAYSGLEALQRVLEADFAVIVLDIQMPGMDGLETAARIQRGARSHATPIIFLTAYDADHLEVFQGYSVGAVDYLSKPFQPAIFRSKVAAFVELFKKTQQLKLQAQLLEERTAELTKANADLRREIAQREQAEEALRTAHGLLERRVADRTAELARANAALKGEVRERLRTEEQMKASLQEKEVLLREIHHRVKNNLQVISSLLSLQARTIKDPLALEKFRESQSQVKTMALIHEKLYRSRNLARIDFAEYLRGLTAHLLRSHGPRGRSVALRVEGADVSLGIDTVIPCALLTHELIANSLKHAFPDGGGEICIHLDAKDGVGTGDRRFVLTIRDNGIGLPAGFDIRQTESLGFQIVTALADQLNATIELADPPGATFHISFSESAAHEKRHDHV
jgi:two-component sensor histidine kinase/ActR/RegA family two-component response regulator